MPAKVPSLYRSRHGVFYLRVCLPEAERRNLKSKEVWRSLRTKDAKIAKGLALRFAIEKNYAMPTKSPKTIADEIVNPLSFTSREGHRIDFDPAKPEEVQFAKEFIAEHTAKTAQTLSDEDRHRLTESELEFRRKELEALRHREALIAVTPPKKVESPLFSKYVEAYLTLIKNSQLNDRTKKSYTAKLKVFQGFLGRSATLAEVTPEKILDFQTWLAKDDPVTDRKAITPRSIDEYSNVISNVYKKVIKKQADNPIEGRLVSKKQQMLSNRKPFTPDELTRIFDPERLAQVKNLRIFLCPFWDC